MEEAFLERRPTDAQNVVDRIMEYECEEMSEEEAIEFFQFLVRSGYIYGLQGAYQRTAQRLIDAGQIEL